MFRFSSLIGSIKSGLAGAYHHTRRCGSWCLHRNWLKLLQVVKMVVEIIKDARSLLFCNQLRTLKVSGFGIVRSHK